MVGRLAWSRSLLPAGALTLSLLLISFLTPQHASAQWSVCVDDPQVWLDNGARVEMRTVIQADSSVVAHITFTLHVPIETASTRIQYTSGVGSSFETVNVVPDSWGGYLINAVATSSGGSSYPVTLTVHTVNRASVWSSAQGFTNQDVMISVQAL